MKLHDSWKRMLCAALTPTLQMMLPSAGASEGDPSAGGAATTSQPAAPPQGHPALLALQRADADFDRACSGTFELARPGRVLPGPEFGKHVEVCRFSTASGVRALLGETQYEHDPEFRPPGSPDYAGLDYDSDGNLIVRRPVRKTALSTPEFNRVLEEQERLLIAPNGEVLTRLQYSTLCLYDIGSPNSTYEFDQFRRATGRALSPYLQTVNSAERRSDGLEELRCAGSDAPGMTGEWHLLVDAEAGQLVREAKFFPPDRDSPVLRVRNSGLFRKEGIALAAQGVLTYALGPGHDLDLTITVRDLTARADDELVEQLRARLTAPLPDNARIIDERRGESKVYLPGKAPPDLPDLRRPPTQ